MESLQLKLHRVSCPVKVASWLSVLLIIFSILYHDLIHIMLLSSLALQIDCFCILCFFGEGSGEGSGHGQEQRVTCLTQLHTPRARSFGKRAPEGSVVRNASKQLRSVDKGFALG